MKKPILDAQRYALLNLFEDDLRFRGDWPKSGMKGKRRKL
jgi:hypothetical protein